MRIGIITGEYPPMQGGVGAYSAILAQTLAQQGHDVYVFSTHKAQNHDKRVHLTNTLQHWRPLSVMAVKNWAKKHHLQVVSLQFETAAYSMSPWVHFLPDILKPIPVVTTFHDLLVPYLFPKAGKIREWIVKRLANASTGIIATNHEDMQQMAQHPKAALIPIGSNILTTLPKDYNRSAWRAKAGVEPDGYLIAHFGFVNHSKGLETLLQTLAKLRHDNLPFQLVMIGGRTGTSDPTNATYAREIDQMIQNMGLTPHIHWTDFVTDHEVTAYLKASDLVVLPFRDGASYRRGSLMAAIQHGCAIITTTPRVDIPAFRHAENMLLFKPEDPKALVRLIKQVITTPPLHYDIIIGASELRHEFDWFTIAQAYVRLLEQAITPGAAPH